MSDPSRLHKPYTTGARPSSALAKSNVHMSAGGWIRTITATDYAWAGNNNTAATPEVLVAGTNWTAETGWFTYSYWATTAPSEGTRIAITVHVHFNEPVTVTGTPTCTITNTKAGGGSATTLVASFTSLHANKHRMYFTTAVPSANQLKEDDILYLGVNCLSLAGGTIKDEGTSTATLISNAAVDGGYRGAPNVNGNRSTAGAEVTNGPRVVVVA